jgi:NSS family neurotransmitter:Na+ symporter
VAVLVFIAGLPAALDGMGTGSFPSPAALLGLGVESPEVLSCWLNLYDGVSEGILMPLGALVMSVIFGWGMGKRLVKVEVEATPNMRLKAAKFWQFCFKYAVPAIMVVVLLAQIQSFL